MKKLLYVLIAALAAGAVLQGCAQKNTDQTPAETAVAAQSGVTQEMAYEGVNNYCHENYDWSVAKDDPEAMYVQMGEESESEYQVVFRSYTGALVNFYVSKADGSTRMTEYVPALDQESDAGTININDYLKK